MNLIHKQLFLYIIEKNLNNSIQEFARQYNLIKMLINN